MAFTRRELCVLLPALLATASAPGTAAEKHDSDDGALPSAVYDFKQLSGNGDKTRTFVPMFQGNTSYGTHVDLHETSLAPGAVVHGMYGHPGDELFLVREGILEVEFDGKRWEVGPGSTAYVASNTVYAIRNTSKQWARYFVLLFGPPHVPSDWKPSHT